jgi:hypothetical protein
MARNRALAAVPEVQERSIGSCRIGLPSAAPDAWWRQPSAQLAERQVGRGLVVLLHQRLGAQVPQHGRGHVDTGRHRGGRAVSVASGHLCAAVRADHQQCIYSSNALSVL